MGLDLVFYDTALSKARPELPGDRLQAMFRRMTPDRRDRLQGRLERTCRKLCLMWQAGDWALEADKEFGTSTLREAPALFGNEAVCVHYHLEALVLFARSALDIGAGIFGELLPKPFLQKRYDSFNDLVKQIGKSGPPGLQLFFLPLRGSETSWLSILCGAERGRSLRDKIAHQTEFPLDYIELNPNSEKEYPVVHFGATRLPIPLPEFIGELRNGVINGFMRIEEVCVSGSGVTETSR